MKPSLKRTASLHLKIDGWNTNDRFLLGVCLFSGAFAVSFREGKNIQKQHQRLGSYMYVVKPLGLGSFKGLEAIVVIRQSNGWTKIWVLGLQQLVYPSACRIATYV